MERQESPAASPETGNMPDGNGQYSFTQLKAAPAEFHGNVVTLSGAVISARRLTGMTEIEILQLPTDAYGRPMPDRQRSGGRFLARQSAFLDSATLAGEPVVTVVGVVEGELERPLEPGADNYLYPIVAVRDLKVWSSDSSKLSALSDVRMDRGGYRQTPETMYDDPSPGWFGSILQGLFGGLFGPSWNSGHRGYRDYYYSGGSYGSTSSSSAAPSSPPSSSRSDIPPQFQKPH